MSTNFTVVITWQYTHTLNPQIVHLKLIYVGCQDYLQRVGKVLKNKKNFFKLFSLFFPLSFLKIKYTIDIDFLKS